MGGILLKLNKIAILSLFIVLICFIGAVSAAEDLNDTAIADSSIDEVNGINIEQTVDDTIESPISEDIEKLIETQNIGDENIGATKGISVPASTWSLLKTYSELTSDYSITLTGNSYFIGDAINFKNSATIIGTSNSYITGGSTSKTPFVNNNSALTVHFKNVKFLNVNAKNLYRTRWYCLFGKLYI